MRTDPASQARPSRFTFSRALVAALVLAFLAILPTLCRGGNESCCFLPEPFETFTTQSLARQDAPTTTVASAKGH